MKSCSWLEEYLADHVYLYGTNVSGEGQGAPGIDVVNGSVYESDAASDTNLGVVSTSAQTFAGNKTFGDKLIAEGQFVTSPTPVQALDANTTVGADKPLSLFQTNSAVNPPERA
jgi:hypothetical protein